MTDGRTTPRGLAEIGAVVIGTGFIGTVHVEALRRIGVQVRGVLGSSPDRGAMRAAQLGVARAYPSLDAVLADPAVDVVHVASPNNLHVPQASAILAGHIRGAKQPDTGLLPLLDGARQILLIFEGDHRRNRAYIPEIKLNQIRIRINRCLTRACRRPRR